ncbi:urease accessory protein UreD [Aestuariicoccus sp. MJ-SS9]|uniref:urease accessory protein UreD n=1 Tax=Aestuariicoccus sp. MJ-SS9 TaxID=3079855 RepID=UPI0029086BB1|nr:urease accessory protein UreD [Aestuariicoccus sp. MJ-SS9]MDU8912029.1 urease accessory protein UreD [Aestuariicoccus sp. MJ-SS9]
MPFDAPPKTPAVAPQRAHGVARLTARRRGPVSVIDGLRQSGAFKLLFPRPRDTALDAVFLNTSGGITGGDRFALTAGAEAGAHLRLTSQAAERIYRAMPGVPGQVRTVLSAESGARIDWLPQETILFEGAALDRTLRIELAAEARLLACETLVFGRAAMRETVRDLRLTDRIDVLREGRLVWADRLRLEGDAQASLDRRFVAAGAQALATLVWAAPGAAERVGALRSLLPESGGASAVLPDLVVLRLAAPDSFELRRHLIPVLQHLSGAALPRPWMI